MEDNSFFLVSNQVYPIRSAVFIGFEVFTSESQIKGTGFYIFKNRQNETTYRIFKIDKQKKPYSEISPVNELKDYMINTTKADLFEAYRNLNQTLLNKIHFEIIDFKSFWPIDFEKSAFTEIIEKIESPPLIKRLTTLRDSMLDD